MSNKSNESSHLVKDIFICLATLAGLIALYYIVPIEAFIGLTGVLVGSIISYFGVKDGFRHTSKENRVQRSIEIRKEVYFKASESFAKMQAILVSMPKMDLEKTGADVDLINDLQKVDLIADINLIKKINICSNFYQKALQEMVFDKMEIDNINHNAKYALDRHSDYLEQMKMYTLDISQSYNLSNKMENCLTYHYDITKDLPFKILNLTRKSIKYSSEFGNLLSDCVSDIRRDIENPFNNEGQKLYKSHTKESIKDSLESGIKFLDDLEKRIKNFKFPDHL